MDKNFNPKDLVIENTEDGQKFIKNGILVMERDDKNFMFWFNDDLVWDYIETFFNMSYEETELFLELWIEENFEENFEGLGYIVTKIW